MEERYLSLSEAADALDISERTAHRWIKSGKLRSYKPGRDHKIPESAIIEAIEAGEVRPKSQAPPSPEQPSFNGLFEEERRKSKLPEVADLLLEFGEMLLVTWEAELPERARADDDEWLGNIAVQWRAFGLINYGVLEELGADGLRDKQGWLARYMDINAAVHRINTAIRDHSVARASGEAGEAEEAAATLEPLAVA